MGGSKVIRVTNIAPQATRDQMQTLFTFVGKVEEIKLYPTIRDVAIPVASRVSFVKFVDRDHVGIAQHLNNTVFIDRALIIVPYEKSDIPDEHSAMQALVQANGLLGVTNEQQLPAHVTNVVDGASYITKDPTFAEHGVPEYPSLTCTLEYGQVEEIRRTVMVGNLAPAADAQQVMEWLADAGEIKYARMCGRDTDESRACLIEFSDQASVIPAMLKSGQQLGDRSLVVAHASMSIAKPQIKTNEMAHREIEEAMRRAQEQQSLISSTMQPVTSYMDEAKRSRSRERGGRRRRSRSRDRRRRSRSRSPRRSHSKYSPVRDRSRRSRSRDRKSRSRRSRSRSRDRSGKSRHRTRSRDRKKDDKDKDRRGSSRDKDRKEKDRNRDKDKDRSRDKDKSDKAKSKETPEKTSKDSGDKSSSLKEKSSKDSSSRARSRSPAKKRSRSPAKKRSRSRSADRRRGARGGRGSRASPSRRRSRSRSRQRQRRSSRSPARSAGRKRSRSPHDSRSQPQRSPDRDHKRRDRGDKPDHKRDKERREKETKPEKTDAKVSRDYDEEEKGFDEEAKKSVSRDASPVRSAADKGREEKSAPAGDDMDISE